MPSAIKAHNDQLAAQSRASLKGKPSGLHRAAAALAICLLLAGSLLPARAAGLLYEQAALMAPGEWRNIAHLTTWPGKDNGVSFRAFQYVNSIDGGRGGADGMGWTQTLAHHEGRLMMILSRSQFQRALMVMEPDGTFWRVNQPPGFDSNAGHPGGRRPFHRLTQDDSYLYFAPSDRPRTAMGWFIRTPLRKPGVFERFGVPIGDSHMDGVGSFATTYVAAWGRFYAYTPGGKLWSWAEGEPEWHFHGQLPGDPADDNRRLSGYAGLLLWNDVQQELAIVGGQTFGNRPATSYKNYRLTAPLGAPELLPDRTDPEGERMLWSSGGSKLIVDPRDGGYLFLRANVLYRSCTLGGRYTPIEDLSGHLPFGAYEPYAPYAHVPDSDVIAFLSHMRGLVLYRLNTLPEHERCAVRNETGERSNAPAGVAGGLHDTEMGRLAARLQAGTHAAIEGVGFPAGYPSFRSWFLRMGRHDTWGDAVYWHPESARIYFQGLERQGDTFIAYDVKANAWLDLTLTGGPQRETRGYHVYNTGALDRAAGRYYRLWRRGRDNADGLPAGVDTLMAYDIGYDAWLVRAPIVPIPTISSSADFSYVPLEWHGAMNKLVLIRARRVWVFDPNADNLQDADAYHNLGPIEVHGYHSTSHYNGTRRDMLVLGGNYSSRAVAVIDTDGRIASVADLPFDHRVAQDKLTHDPVSGNYLIYRAASHELWELDPDLENWRKVASFADAPWRQAHAGLRLAPIPELGVIFMQTEHGARLYKHRDAHEPERHPRPAPPTTDRPRPPAALPVPAPPPALQAQPQSRAQPEPNAPRPMPRPDASNAVEPTPAPNARALSSAMIRAIRRCPISTSDSSCLR